MAEVEEKREAYSKMKSWADHCSSDEESDDELHPARLASNSDIGGDLSYEDDKSEGSISVTADDNLEDIVPGGGSRGGRGGRNNRNNEETPHPRPIDFNNVPPELPKQPPYTAYIRNLCFKIQEPDDLANKVEGLTRWRYKKQHEVRVINARLGIDRNTGKRKGFGYVEFETLEELMLFLNLNDGFSRINGRDIIIDIANNTRGNKNNNNNNNRNNSYRRTNSENNTSHMSNISEIDGSQFRGGRYSKNNSTGNLNKSAPAPPMERRSLKLAPRSKPIDGAERSTSQSSIFGDAKPRDEQSWMKKKLEVENEANATEAANNNTESEKKNEEESMHAPTEAPAASSEVVEAATTTDVAAVTDENAQESSHQQGNSDRNAGRGGRGRGSGGGERKHNATRGSGGRGGGGRGGRGRNNRKTSDRNKNSNQGGKDANGWDEAKGGPSAVPQQQESKMPSVEKKESKSTKAANKFAAFLDDSDSDSE